MPAYRPPPLAPSGQAEAPHYASPQVPPVQEQATTAMLSPPPAPAPMTAPAAPPAGGNRIQQVENFIARYEGGDCFFIRPVAVSANAAQIEGYGASIALFQTLDSAFKSSNGFEADIGVRQVTPAQCPAVTFLSRQRFAGTRAPRLDLAKTNVHSGEILRGEVAAEPGRHVDLMLVTDEGAVHNVTALLKRAANGSSFSMGLQRSGAPGARPQLLLAFASSRPLATLQGASGAPASQLFAGLAAEIAQSGQPVAVTARYFKLE
jgi:serine/threonine-protein kinase